MLTARFDYPHRRTSAVSIAYFPQLRRTTHRISGFYQLATTTTSCRVLLKTEEGDRNRGFPVGREGYFLHPPSGQTPNTTRPRWKNHLSLVTAGTPSNRGHCTGNASLSDRPTRWMRLRILQRQIFPGVLLDEARPGLPASVDGQTITFVTASPTPASTTVEVCGLLCSRTLFACPHRWTLLSRITRRETTSVASTGLSRP